jgi:hypothetical protein
MLDFFGPFDERVSALECERLYNERFAKLDDRLPEYRGPDVVFALPHPWEHVGRTEVGDVTPRFWP